MRIKTLLLAGALAVTGPSFAQHMEGQHDHHEGAEQLGEVDFPISCSAPAQGHFNRGVAWLHSFEYAEAERAFLAAAAADPSCAMSHWGAAMTQYHPLWAPPTPSELERGRAALARAQALDARTPRERDFIAALAAFYHAPAGSSHRDRTLAYEAAMERLHQSHAGDAEAAVFHALALIAAGMIDEDAVFARERRAAAILNAALATHPNHPGVAHYLIHGYDYPPLAELALPAARRYADIAPASSHAQHMPSHIFTRLGLWDEAIRSNIAAEASARAYARRVNLTGSFDQRLHAMDYLAYAYLQRGDDRRAGQVREELDRIEQVTPVTFAAAFAFSAIPARIALERRQWAEAAELALSPNAMRAIPWDQYRWGEANLHFARAVGAARSGRPELARREIEALEAIRQALAGASGNYDWSAQVEIQRRIASAWTAAAEGDREEALRTMRSAAELDDTTEKHPVTPGAILPAREQLGELLLELRRPAEALIEFQAVLFRAPHRFNAIHGAARAAREAGDAAQARGYYTQLIALGCPAGARPELAEAEAFLDAPASCRTDAT